MKRPASIHRHVPINCPKCSRQKQGGGVLFRVVLSRLEDGLGHEGYRCDKCGHTIKTVPDLAAVHADLVAAALARAAPAVHHTHARIAGRDRATAQPCDETGPDGRAVRTWDVYRNGGCIASGFATRADARAEAARLNTTPAMPLQAWHVATAKLDGDPDITDDQVNAAHAVLDAAKGTDL